MFTDEKKIPHLLKATEVASALNLSKTHVYHLARRGELPAVFVGERSVRFDPIDVQNFIDSHRARGER